MIEYLIKSSACLCIFMLFYSLFLEKENMHVFKRFYLLASVLISLGIPFITFTQFVEVPAGINGSIVNHSTNAAQFTSKESINYIPYFLWTVYLLGVGVFSIKFIFNLIKITLKIKQNPKLKTKKSTHVLLKELIVPHTFFNFIFLNKSNFEKAKIPKEVLIHEEAHVMQKHTIDVLFIEICQILLWFNPLIYFIKKSIKLNHEFLADLKVIEQGVSLSKYQEIILAFSSNALEPQLATAINYSSIKKRFTVMKTTSSKTSIWLRGLVLLPMLAFLIFSFSTKKIIEKETKVQSEITNKTQQKASPKELAEYNKLAKKYNAQPENMRVVKLDDLERMEYIYKKMTMEQKATAEPFPNCPPPPPAPPKSPEMKTAHDLPPPPPIPVNASPEERVKYQKTIDAYNNGDASYTYKNKNCKEVTVIPDEDEMVPPPPPKSPLDFVVEMAKKNATFYYEEKIITSNDAIKLLKENKAMNISSKNSMSKNPKVYLSKEPIIIGN